MENEWAKEGKKKKTAEKYPRGKSAMMETNSGGGREI